MEEQKALKELGGWTAPCAAFDYRKLEQEAQRECQTIRRLLAAKHARKSRDAEEEFTRRREICILTDMYYEQRYYASLFHSLAHPEDKQP